MSGQNYSRIYTIIHPEILELRDITISVYFTSSDELLYIQVLKKFVKKRVSLDTLVWFIKPHGL